MALRDLTFRAPRNICAPPAYCAHHTRVTLYRAILYEAFLFSSDSELCKSHCKRLRLSCERHSGAAVPGASGGPQGPLVVSGGITT